MIVKLNGKLVEVNVPHKCGITSVLGILANQPISKAKSKGALGDDLIYTPSLFNPFKDVDPDIKIAIVRNPLKRIKSIWGDRIKKKNKIRIEDTSFQYFYENFYALHAHDDIRKHCQTQISYIGTYTKYYDHIFDITELNGEFKDIISEITGKDIPSIRTNVSNNSDFDLTEEQIKYFSHIYSLDYLYYGDYFR